MVVMFPRITASTRMATRKMVLRDGLMIRHITRLISSIAGVRVATRRICMKAIWTLFTSVVVRVTRLAVENLSMFLKE